jgi:hypothetical protein
MNTARHATIYIDGDACEIPAGRRTGAEIRALVSPPAAGLWLVVGDAQDREMSPDAVVTVVEGMRFYTCENITIYLDSTPYRVPAGTVTEQQLRDLPTPPISEEFVLFHDIPDALDRRLAPNEILEVADGARFFSVREHHSRDVTIIVNATRHTVPAGLISFEALAALAFPVPPGPNPEYTVSYRGGDPRHPEGTVVEGQSVKVREGMIFNVTGTDKS